MRYKVDLHTHSVASYDGGIGKEEYARVLETGELNCIAITDHNEISFAKEMRQAYGDKIIVGEEITTKDGEIIGLFLEKVVPKNKTALETVKLIHEQDGIVYIPHPYETLRKGLQMDVLQNIPKDVDIIEVFNARARWRGESSRALKFAHKYKKAQASSSDAHCRMGIATSYSIINEMPSKENIVQLLETAKLEKSYAPIISYLCPAANKIINRLFRR